jgi:hypothetical protein
MTVVSALILALGCTYKLVMYFAYSKTEGIALFFVIGAVALFFFANGNKQK